MANTFLKGLTLTLMLAAVVVASAQGGGGRQRGGQRGRGFSELQILARTDVQADLAITDDQKGKLDDLRTKAQEAMRAQFANRQGGGGGTPPTAEERAAQQKLAEEARETQNKAIAEILTPAQVTRLGEIGLQIRGFSAVGDAKIQKALGLSADQITKVKELGTKAQEANRAVQQKIRSQELTREDAQATMKKNTDILNQELEKVLSADQAAKFKTMQGKPFKAEEQNG